MLLALAAISAAVGAIGLGRVVFPYDVGHYEANSWAPSALLAHGHDPYELDRATSDPYVVARSRPIAWCKTAADGTK